MKDYLIGSDMSAVAGSDWGVPALVDDPDWGKPVTVGSADLGAYQREMKKLKQAPVTIAQILLRGGLQAINGAINGAKQPWYKSDLPGQTKRNEVLGKLNWHQATIANMAFTPNAMYPHLDDLKNWVAQAYVEGNAVEEGAAYLDASWTQMWADIKLAIAALPQDVRAAVGDLVQNVTGLPVWAWALVGIGTIVIIGGIVYAIINSKAGAAVAGTVAHKYL